MNYSNELLYHVTQESNRIEAEPLKGQSFDNHWRCTLLARTAASEKQLLHPRILQQLLFEGLANPSIAQPVSAPGEYRLVDVYVYTQNGLRNYFSPPEMVPALMKAWWAEWRRQKELAFHPDAIGQDVVRWWFHAWFEAIHPFVDGNGRVGRLLWWNMTMLADKEIEIVTFAERQAYYDRLEAWRNEHSDKPEMNPFTGVGAIAP